jgi:beta-glucanase (GH16 family)
MRLCLKLLPIALCVLIGSIFSGLAAASCSAGPCSLVWADDINGTAADISKWEFMIGDGCSFGICGWGNNELQYYRSQNAIVANGELTITAKRENFGGKNYTSARLRTQNSINGRSEQ